ncbi:N-acetylmuramoyl-L-alanine amidase [Solemya pervernicosa gill symbiont]|uniref:N-acetylmuramoyl-L-alanine amidase AmiC n=2 Tax=Gammaproteobacteria incertae sedis TaxID=118884 RepID=A0A1T2L7P3_9GAMM|nr:N-acetylmuramoyl-L-alanine amidase [Candidatus Reidiella endopervernicosa]OOZ41080.1 N-acetylmuramoyl-L-alanine amidase [Solemya pervernicosa gill symbiont]QKQ26241.1 N-acetylmuramoyl-L-alanine amidase [Candidatus Reidiella endopervernicosa]
MKRFTILLLLLLIAPTGFAAAVEVKDFRLWNAPDKTRLVFDISAPVEHNLFTLPNPDRVVIDLKSTKLKTKFSQQKGPVLASIRSAPRNKGKDLRLVLDLSKKAKPKSFLLKPTQEYGHRLVIDLEFAAERVTKKKSVPVKAVKSLAKPAALRDLVIAIDAGHGGEDPGAKGRRGTREKDVVLAIARQLEKLLKREPGMRPVMIRNGDYYVGLRKRTEKARRANADLFVSIHADAFRDRRARGASVYVLSSRGATNEAARWLADSENAADLVGGVSLDDKDDLLASVLLDLSQTATIEASLEVGDKVLHQLKGLGRVHKRRVEQAGFRVLKSPDIPSILIETAFISNPEEERKLRDPRHQKKMAAAILKGVRAYFSNKAPAGTIIASRQPQSHTIRSGDTLGHIAARYHVTVSTLRKANRINGDRIRVGQVLKIPTSGDT